MTMDKTTKHRMEEWFLSSSFNYGTLQMMSHQFRNSMANDHPGPVTLSHTLLKVGPSKYSQDKVLLHQEEHLPFQKLLQGVIGHTHMTIILFSLLNVFKLVLKNVSF